MRQFRMNREHTSYSLIHVLTVLVPLQGAASCVRLSSTLGVGGVPAGDYPSIPWVVKDEIF